MVLNRREADRFKKSNGVNCISHEAKVVKDMKLNDRPETHLWL